MNRKIPISGLETQLAREAAEAAYPPTASPAIKDLSTRQLRMYAVTPDDHKFVNELIDEIERLRNAK